MSFPTRTEAADYTVTPWVDTLQQKWLFDTEKNRWHNEPSSLTGTGEGGGVLVSGVTPSYNYPGMRWFRTVDGVTYTYFDGFWVADDSAPAPDLADVWTALDTKLSAVATVVEITAADTTAESAHANAYLYFNNTSAKFYRVPNDATLLLPIGTTITLSNVAATGTLTIAPLNGSVELIYDTLAAEWNILDQYEIAQLIKVAADEWHLL